MCITAFAPNASYYVQCIFKSNCRASSTHVQRTHYNQCTMHVQRMRDMCGVNAQCMWSKCTTHVERMHNACKANAQRMWSECATHVERMRNACAAMCNTCTANARRMCSECATHVQRMHNARGVNIIVLCTHLQ
jgi:hypothetical protein